MLSPRLLCAATQRCLLFALVAVHRAAMLLFALVAVHRAAVMMCSISYHNMIVQKTVVEFP